MSGEWFGWPGALPVLVAAPALWFLLRARDRVRARKVVGSAGARASVLAGVSGSRRKAARGLAAAAALFALASIAQPRWGAASEHIRPRGADVVVCLDVSRSMLARDVAPSRLAAAKEEIRALAERARGDRLGLVVFAGEARLVAPLTGDVESVAGLAGLADPWSLSSGGTDVAAALRTALDALDGGSGDHQAIVLLTDGEDLARQGAHVARECRERGVIAHAVGVGSKAGSKIPVAAEHGEAFLRDAAGREVVSALDETGLRRIAEEAGGSYAHAATPGALVEVYEGAIRPLARQSFERRAGGTRPNRFQWPLLAAVVLWLLEVGLSHRRRS